MLSLRMLHQEFEPPELLQNIIKCFWYDRKNSIELKAGLEVVPDGYAEIIFYFGSLFNISNKQKLPSLPSPFMIGLLNHPVSFHAENQLEIIGIRCFPWTVFDLLGLPPAKDGVRIFKHPIAQLQPILAELVNAGKIKEAIEQIKTYLSTTKTITNNVLLKAGIAMSQSNGTILVSQIATAAHVSVRTLERKFKQSAGYTVKDVSGIMRFEQVRNKLWRHPNANLVGLALEFGYADQAHLSKEFKRYSGITPTAFARKTKIDNYVVNNDFIAIINP